MGRPNAKVLRSRDHLTKLWQMRQLDWGENWKGGNQDHCCDNVAHQKSHQPIVRDGKVGVSRLPEEDHHQCNDAACDWVFESALAGSSSSNSSIAWDTLNGGNDCWIWRMRTAHRVADVESRSVDNLLPGFAGRHRRRTPPAVRYSCLTCHGKNRQSPASTRYMNRQSPASTRYILVWTVVHQDCTNLTHAQCFVKKMKLEYRHSYDASKKN